MSYTCLRYHIIFATKERKPFLDEAIRERLFSYLGAMLARRKSKAFIINGPEDHLHLLLSLSPELSLSDFMRTLKANSSKWVHETFPRYQDFGWQEGYSAFSVSASAVDDVYRYIENQQEHHKQISFVDELKQFLDAHQIEYDPKYLG